MKLCVVLVRVQGPINLGLITRACSNLGVNDLRLVDPGCSTDALEARMFAVHAQPLLAKSRVFPSLAVAVADCDWVVGTTARRRRDRLAVISPEEIVPLAQERPLKRMALVFGSEADGLNRDELQHCDVAAHLQTPGDYTSYNLSHAVAITLYLVATAGATPARTAQGVANQQQLSKLHALWLDTLTRAGYFRRTDATRFAPKLRRLLGRWRMSAHDVNTLWGMLAHLQRALSEPRKITKSAK